VLVTLVSIKFGSSIIIINLAKLDDGLAESPTVMVVDKKNKRKKTIFVKNRGILKPSWAFVETKN
jgi:hypothetical protein